MCGCDGFIEIDGGWVGRKAQVERAGAKGGNGTGSLFLPGCQATPGAAPLRVPVQMTVGPEDPLERANGAK